MQDILTHLITLAEAEDKGVRLRVCQLLQLIINNQVGATCCSCRPLKYIAWKTRRAQHLLHVLMACYIQPAGHLKLQRAHSAWILPLHQLSQQASDQAPSGHGMAEVQGTVEHRLQEQRTTDRARHHDML
jgi:hypothetical protein